jgi:subtilisin family serine protease
VSEVLDPHLRFVIDQAAGVGLDSIAESSRFALAEEEPALVRVLVRCGGDHSTLEDAGLRIETVAGEIVTGTAPIDALGGLADHYSVEAVEGARPLAGELDLSIPACRADVVHADPPGFGLRGNGVVVGIVDSGIDWRHDNFRRADGTSRVLRVWDQFLTPEGEESGPQGFSYGVEYDNTDIDRALASADPLAVVRHMDDEVGHGTHVSGIAAGNGRAAGQGKPANAFVGLAPEADLIVVAVRGGGERGIGDSASALDAVSYIFQRAAELGRSVAVNMSLGDNLGAHDGTSLLEQGLDNLLVGQGRVMIKSAGNAGADGIHAGGSLTQGGEETMSFTVRTGDTSPETMDIWYDGADRLEIRITEPGGATSAPVVPGSSTNLSLGNGNQVFVDSSLNDPNNGANRIFIVLQPGQAPSLEDGQWSLTLSGTAVTNGRFDAWIQRGSRIARFDPPHEDQMMTISTPGTSRKMITAGCYITRADNDLGDLSVFSSRGPTRDMRSAPDVAAPGQEIFSVARGPSPDPYVSMMGTSMAAPHVTGAVALMLQQNGSLDQQQVKDRLRATAVGDQFAAHLPNDHWGAGKLDVAGAVGSTPGAGAPQSAPKTPARD